MSIPTSVSKGDQVTVQFEGRLPDGTVFEASTEDKPLSFAAGGEDVLKGVSDAVIGMSVGETREVEVPPEMGFGERHDALVPPLLGASLLAVALFGGPVLRAASLALTFAAPSTRSSGPRGAASGRGREGRLGRRDLQNRRR